MKNNNQKKVLDILLPALVCQKDAGELFFNNEKKVVIKCKKCGQEYKIENGIIMMTEIQGIENNDMQAEIKARDKEAEKYDERLSSRYHKEVIPTLRELDPRENEKIIEYACGTGRLTQEVVKAGSFVLAVDFSLESLKVLQNKNLDNVLLVWADASNFKTKENFFDKAFSAQFYEHLPDSEIRKKYLFNSHQTLKPNGLSLNTVYHYDLRKRIKGEVKEGKHKGGIYFKYYTKKELKKDFKEVFSRIKIKIIDITLPLEARLNSSQKTRGIISRACEKISVIKCLGHLLLIKTRK